MSFTKNQLIPGEKLVILTRPHVLVLLRAILVNIGTLAVLIGLSLAVAKPWFLLVQNAPLIFLAWEILVRNHREYILTNHRVVKQDGVFSITSFDASLDKVNNVFHEQSLWGRIFKYGDVGLETASEQGTTVFYHVPDPVSFKNSIVREREQYKSTSASGAPSAGEEVPRLIQDLASLRDRGIISIDEFELKKRALLDRIQ